MRRTSAFVEGMRSAFDLAPKQTRHKANFISEAKTPKVDTHISINDSASAWIAVGSYMKKAANRFELQHNVNK